MVHSPRYQNHRLLRRTDSLLRILGKWRDRTPRIRLATDDGEAVVVNIIAAVFVDGVDIRGRGDAKGVFADERFVREIEEAGD